MKKVVIRFKSIYDIRSLENYLNTMEQKGYRVKKVGRFHIVFEQRGERPIQKYAVRRCSIRHITAFLKEYAGTWTKYLVPTKRLLIMASLDNEPIAPPFESNHYKPVSSKYGLWTYWGYIVLLLLFEITLALIEDVLDPIDYLALTLLALFPIGLVLMAVAEHLLKNSSRIKYDSILSNFYSAGKVLTLVGGVAFIYKGVEKVINLIAFLDQNRHLIGSANDFLIVIMLLALVVFLGIFISKIIKSVTDE